MTIQKKLARIVGLLDAVASELEERGFDAQRELIDRATDAIDDVRDAFDGL